MSDAFCCGRWAPSGEQEEGEEKRGDACGGKLEGGKIRAGVDAQERPRPPTETVIRVMVVFRFYIIKKTHCIITKSKGKYIYLTFIIILRYWYFHKCYLTAVVTMQFYLTFSLRRSWLLSRKKVSNSQLSFSSIKHVFLIRSVEQYVIL